MKRFLALMAATTAAYACVPEANKAVANKAVFYTGLTQGLDQFAHTIEALGNTNAMELRRHHMGLILGCKWIESNAKGWELGGELLARLNDHHGTKKDLHASLARTVNQMNLTHSQGVEIAARIGYKTPLDGIVSPTFFMKLGYATHPIHMTVNSTHAGDHAIRKQFNGICVGAGLDFPITERFAVGLDYTHVFYKQTDIPVLQGKIHSNSIRARLTHTF